MSALPVIAAASSSTSTSLTSFLAAFVAGADSWRVWSGLLAAAAFGSWAEKNTAWGKELSGPLVATLGGLALASCNLIPAGAAPEYSSVNSRLLPLAVPLLLFTADLRRTVADAGRLLVPFVIGAAATAAATVLAFAVVPLTALEGMASSSASSAAAAASASSSSSSSVLVGWRVAAALAARHIGGAVNYVGVCEALSVPASAAAAALAADNLVCVAYFAAVFRLARGVEPEPGDDDEESRSPSPSSADAEKPSCEKPAAFTVTDALTALSISAVVCALGGALASAALGLSPGSSVIPAATALAVALATAFPGLTRPLAPAADAVAAALLQVFFAAVGAAGSVAAVLGSAPSLFAFCGIQIFGHLGIVLFVGRVVPKLLARLFRGENEGKGESSPGFALRDLLLASNANVGGPTTAAGMAAAKGWRSSVVPCVLVGTLGYATATFVALALGQGVLRWMR